VIWQPIETAPKDGTEILAWREDCGVLLIRWDCLDNICSEAEARDMTEDELFEMDWFCADFVAGDRLQEPVTHWMPLPEPPEGA